MKKIWMVGVLSGLLLASNAFAQFAWQYKDKNGNRVISDTPPPRDSEARVIGERAKRNRVGAQKKSRDELAEERSLATRCLQAREKLTHLVGTTSQDIVPPDIYAEIDSLELFITNNCERKPAATNAEGKN